MRQTERDTHVNAIRAEHEHRAAHDPQTRARHLRLAHIWRSLEAKAAHEAQMFAEVQETRQQWEAITQATRRIAIAADLELRRCHPGLPIPLLRPHAAERDGITGSAPDDLAWVQLTLDGMTHPVCASSSGPSRGERARDHWSADADGQFTLGLTPATAHQEIPEHVLRIRGNVKAAQAS